MRFIKFFIFGSLLTFFVMVITNIFLGMGSNSGLTQDYILNIIFSIMFVLLFGVFITGLFFFLTKIKRNKTKHFFIVIAVLSVILQIMLVLFIPAGLHTDMLTVFDNAKNFLNGNFSAFNVGNYLSRYPNNIGYTLFVSGILSFFKNSILIVRLVNVIFTTLTMFYTYLLFIKMFPRFKEYSLSVYAIAFLFVPAILMNNLFYGDISSISFCVIGVYYAMRYVETSKYRYLLLSSLLIMLGNFMRGSGVIFLGAIIVYFIFQFILSDTKPFIKLKGFVSIVVLIAFFCLPVQVFDFVGLQTGIIKEPIYTHSIPIVSWVEMGIPGNGSLGRWNNDNNKIVKETGYDKNKATDLIFAKLSDKLVEKGPIQSVVDYYDKMMYLWSDGSFEAEFYGMPTGKASKNFKYLYQTPISKYINQNQDFTLILQWIFKYSYLWLLIFASAYLIFTIKRKKFEFEIGVYLIGGFILFYLFWEIKIRYIFGVYPFLLIIALAGLSEVVDKLRRWRFNRKS